MKDLVACGSLAFALVLSPLGSTSGQEIQGVCTCHGVPADSCPYVIGGGSEPPYDPYEEYDSEPYAYDPGPEARQHAQWGKEYAAVGRYEDALSEYRQSLALQPQGYVYVDLGNALDVLGRSEEALECYRQAMGFGQTEAWYNAGVVLDRLGRDAEALDHYREAIRLGYGANAWWGLGSSLQDLGRLEEAIEGLRQALVLRPDCWGAYRGLANVCSDLGDRCFESGDWAAAETWYRESILRDPTGHGGFDHSRLGLAYLKEDDIERGARVLARGARSNPSNSTLANNLGLALGQMGEISRAREEFARAQSLEPENTTYQANAAWVANHAYFIAPEAFQSIAPDLLTRVAGYAQALEKATGKGFFVTSGRRDERGQAKAMYDVMKEKSAEELRKGGYTNVEAYEEVLAAFRSGGTEEEAVQAMTRVLEDQKERRGIFLSKHMKDGAVDIRSKGMSPEQKDSLVKTVAQTEGDLRVTRRERTVQTKSGPKTETTWDMIDAEGRVVIQIIDEVSPPHIHLEFQERTQP